MIIDCHTHIGHEAITQQQSPEELLKLMESSGIDKSVVFPFGPFKSRDQSYYEENEKISRLNSNSKFIVFGRINQLSKDMFSEIEHIDSLGLKGVKMHTEKESLKSYKALFRKLDKFNLPLIIHTGNSVNSDVNQLRNLPFTGDIIIGHGGKDRYLDAINIVNSSSNIYIETSLLSLRRTKILIDKVMDKSKILFGSDAPFHHPELESKKILYSCRDRVLVRKILGRNIEKIVK